LKGKGRKSKKRKRERETKKKEIDEKALKLIWALKPFYNSTFHPTTPSLEWRRRQQ
jgi:hypothetical protein